MNKETYRLLENYMLSCMDDAAHDKEHIYRVLYNALEIAKAEQNVNTVLTSVMTAKEAKALAEELGAAALLPVLQ